MQYRIALCGFSEFEYRAMHFSFQHPAEGDEGYEVVDALADADFAVVDADTKPAVKGVVLTGRVGRSVFVGTIAPPGAGALVPRPIDLARISRSLAELAARHAVSPPAEPLAAESGFDIDDDVGGEVGHEVGRGFDDTTDADRIGPLSEPPVLTDSVPLDGPSWSQPTTREAELAPEPVFRFPPKAKAKPKAPPPPPPAPPMVARAPAPAPMPMPAPPPQLESPEAAARSAAKAKARAAARRARLEQSGVTTDPGQLDSLRDVLVLDADDAASAQLTELLELFGFRVHVAPDIARAADVFSRQALVAAFLDITLDGTDDGEGLALLQTINDLPRLVGLPTPAVITVSEQLDPAARVRAALAGIHPLTKPVTRGDVARALEACNVILPSDARRV